jgi:hypothetical protein
MTMIAGVEPGQRQLNGPRTTGRSYRNLSAPQHSITCDEDVRVGMRDSIELLADVYGRY